MFINKRNVSLEMSLIDDKNQKEVFGLPFTVLKYILRQDIVHQIQSQVYKLQQTLLKRCKNKDERNKLIECSKRWLVKLLLNYEQNMHLFEEPIRKLFTSSYPVMTVPKSLKGLLSKNINPRILDEELNDLKSRYKRALYLQAMLTKEKESGKNIDDTYVKLYHMEDIIQKLNGNNVFIKEMTLLSALFCSEIFGVEYSLIKFNATDRMISNDNLNLNFTEI